MICNKCGADNGQSALFCAQCGTKLDAISSSIEENEVVAVTTPEGEALPSQEPLTTNTNEETSLSESPSSAPKEINIKLPSNRVLKMIAAGVAIVVCAMIAFLLLKPESFNLPKSAVEANELFEKLQAKASESLTAGDYEKSATYFTKHNEIADALIKQYLDGSADPEGLTDIAKSAKEKAYGMIEPKIVELVQALDAKGDRKGIASIFSIQMLNDANKGVLVPIVVDIFAEQSAFEKVNLLLRMYMTPFSAEALNKTLEIQKKLDEKYPDRDKGWKIVDIGEYDKAESFKNGFAKVAKANGKDASGKAIYKWGLIDTTGKVVVQVQYDGIGEFLEGRAAVKANNKWGFIDETGKEIIPVTYDELKDPLDATFYVYAKRDPEKIYKGFYNGFAAVKKGGKWGFIDYDGKGLGPGLIYDDVQIFSENCAPVEIGKKYGLLGSNGSYVIEPNTIGADGINFDVVRPIFEGLGGANWDGRSERGVIDRTGMLMFYIDKTEVDLVQDYREGLASVRKFNTSGKAKWGFMDRNGYVTIPIIYDEVTVFIDGVAKVKQGNKFGLINRFGEQLLPISYDQISGFKDGFAVVTQNGKKGIVDLSGKLVVTPRYTAINAFSNGVAGFQNNGKWGILDETGSIVVEPVFDSLKGYNNGVAPAKINGKWGYADISGFFTIEPQFDEAFEFSDGLAAVKKDNKFTYIKLEKIPTNLIGQVVDVFDQPVPNTKLMVFKPGDSDPIATLLSNEIGLFKTVLPNGNYIIKTEKEGYLEVASYITMTEGEDQYTSRITLIKGSEGDRSIAKLNIGNALTGEGLSAVTVKFRSGFNNKSTDYVKDATGQDISVTTDGSGYFQVELPVGAYTAEAKLDGYAPSYMNFVVSMDYNYDTMSLKSLPMTQQLAEGETRITLEWGSNPADLDSHLIGPVAGSYEQFHIYYPNKGQRIEDTMLDKDDTQGNGFETTTIYQQHDGSYRFAVFNYSDGGDYSSSRMSNSGARVRVYQGAACVATFDIPTNRSGNLWDVFELRGNKIVPINNVTNHLDASFYNY